MIYSVGHSNHALDVFLELLSAYEIRQLADVRSVPASRRHPHFAQQALSAALEQHGIGYRHFPALGGLRRPRPDSVNSGLRNEGYRGYADHMLCGEFAHARDRLIEYAGLAPTVIMCAELRYLDCHRQLLSDALLVSGVPVLHIQRGAAPKRHVLSEFARVETGKVIYPGLL